MYSLVKLYNICKTGAHRLLKIIVDNFVMTRKSPLKVAPTTFAMF